SSPPPKSAHATEGVPANSLSDARLRGDADKPSESGSPSESAETNDPTQPYTTKVGDADSSSLRGGGDASRGGGATGKGGRITKAECERVFDKYIELEMETNPQLAGLPREVIEQAKQTARQKHGEAPCTATRAQYNCAMAATS